MVVRQLLDTLKWRWLSTITVNNRSRELKARLCIRFSPRTVRWASPSTTWRSEHRRQSSAPPPAPPPAAVGALGRRLAPPPPPAAAVALRCRPASQLPPPPAAAAALLRRPASPLPNVSVSSTNTQQCGFHTGRIWRASDFARTKRELRFRAVVNGWSAI